MTDNQNSSRRELKIECEWCGIPESNSWISVRSTGPRHAFTKHYCSKDCSKADNVEKNRFWAKFWCGFTVVVGLPFFFFATLERTLGMLLLPTIIAGIIGIGLFPHYYLNSREGLRIQRIIPKDSRAIKGQRRLRVLERATIDVSCPRCGTILELSEVESDNIYRCKYCGAEGIIEWPSDPENQAKND
ncbi:MAG: hypothetical protein ACW960_04845 [Candidatus Thorarchaeota archaeon]|jgi:DNA-directed RNA polymerase subunit RPC12/RpoP